MKNRFLIVAFILLLAGSLTLGGCARQKLKIAAENKAPADWVVLTPEAMKSAGLHTLIVQQQNAGNQIVTVGEIKASENRVFHINSFVGGRISRDNVSLGDTIRQGQTLAVVQNLEVVKIQSDYIHQLHQNEIDIEQAKTRLALAQKNLDRERRLLAEGISPRKDYQQAEADVMLTRSELNGKREHTVHLQAEAQALLSAYGVSPKNSHSEKISTGSPVTAPRSGVITRKNITMGDMVTPETILYEVADLSQVWLDVTVYPKNLDQIRIGQNVRFSTDSLPNHPFTGKIDYILPAAMENSRTYVARVYLDNSAGLLKPNMFGQAVIEQPVVQGKPFVPETAVQKYGRETFVFIPMGNYRFRKQVVQLGEHVTGGYLINDGLSAGAQVVGPGSFILKSEMLKSHFSEEENQEE